MSKAFAKETELVLAFRDWLQERRWSTNATTNGDGWIVYPETAGWDLLLAHNEHGIQIGIEAKLSLNAKVLEQALPPHRWAAEIGPDYRAVLVPGDSCQHHMASLAAHLGVTVITIDALHDEYERRRGRLWRCTAELPTEIREYSDRNWFSWLPTTRETLPEYVPDVCGGDSAPVALTPWKVKAIKLLILLERRGAVTRRDMKALELSPSRWTAPYHGFLAPTPDGYVRYERTPDLKAQHPRNWVEIEADFDQWNPDAARESAR